MILFILLRSKLKLAAVKRERKNKPVKKIRSFNLLKRKESAERVEILNATDKAAEAINKLIMRELKLTLNPVFLCFYENAAEYPVLWTGMNAAI
ncbi:MAG: hypothetical protein A2042_10035 [Candidatus Schekmanbacteria bacterium GWA2_38_11]|uniref:Uncharacterized protein n=1 Tax=Candidatus Schekmanbacteria bacterium GWA2_38_11 TaxID=1817876 RepID=A0A1F7RCV2_9BACT|nr:MAG: hypothetical protein A2042_10035 [Candidatus Schekmanbacteria bacterium GWA2_38_11]